MLIVTRKKPKHGHEDKTYVFLHVPKCAGSHFRKVVQENVSDEFYIKEDGLATHSPYQSIRKYSDGQIYLPIHSANNALSRVHAFSLLREACQIESLWNLYKVVHTQKLNWNHFMLDILSKKLCWRHLTASG